MSFWSKSETSKEERMEKMSQVIPKLVSVVETNQERLDACSDVFRQEYGLWKCQKKADFKNMLTALAESHIQYYQHVSIHIKCFHIVFFIFFFIGNHEISFQCAASWDLVFKRMTSE